MRVHVVVGLAAFLVTALASAQPLAVEPEAIEHVLQSYHGITARELPTLGEADGGFLRYIGAPPEGVFLLGSGGQKAAGPVEAALQFVDEHAGALGILSSSVTFDPVALNERESGDYVRLQQKYGSYPVFGAQVVVQLESEAAVRSVLSDIMRDTRTLDSGEVPLGAVISSVQAITAARTAIAALYPDTTASSLQAEAQPALMVYRPQVLGLDGVTRVVYYLVLRNASNTVREAVLVDAHAGEVVLYYSLLHDAKERVVLDARGQTRIPTQAVRSEGDPASGIRDVDDAYDFTGDSYDFYAEHHGRDSIDDGGMEIISIVRLPIQNAFWDSVQLSFGTGFAVDDVTAHEYTHGVTEFTSNLIYFGFSGAINESFSDIWGEYVDLTNGKGDDREAYRWFIGEDLIFGGGGPIEEQTKFRPVKQNEEIPPNAIRYMKDPTLLGSPDRLGSPLLASPTAFFDQGGVHINSGIGNKMCYLLTDGDTFNGEEVTGFGIDVVADLFYETQFLLSPSADYEDLYFALGSASVSLDLSFEERLNVAAAGRAVEIAPNQALTQGLRNLRATPTRDTEGNPVIAVTWTPPPANDYEEILLVRSVLGFAMTPEEGTIIFRGKDSKFLDVSVQEGVQYFYTAIAETSAGFPESDFARATAGTVAASYATEAFSGFTVTRPPVDLAFGQLLFSPVGPPSMPVGSDNGIGSYGGYEVTFTPGVAAIPVPRQDTEGAAFLLPLSDDGGIGYAFGPAGFPFFGQQYSSMYIGSNGYLSFVPLATTTPLNFPSLGAHFGVPRISFLFSDLAPSVGGTVWARSLSDRTVVTFENVPEQDFFGFGVPATNTVQVELFASGHIRISYQQIGALNAVIGLSDGNGPPIDPADVFDDVQSVPTDTDLSASPAQPQQLGFMAAGAQFADAGERIEFTVVSISPPGSSGVPVLTAVWDGPGAPPFGDNGDGTGAFNWQTALTDEGIYTLRVIATLGDEQAHTDVRLVVGQVFPLPEALNLTLSGGLPGENPSEDHEIPSENPLIANYDFFHPIPERFVEGPSTIFWLRNGLAMQSLINQTTVPSSLTQAGDQWQFRVLPAAIDFEFLTLVVGHEAISPTVTITGVPEITSVVPGFGPTRGGTLVTLKGSRLSAPLSVKFGGVEVQSLQVVNDSELRVVTPVHNAGTVAISVTTSLGTGTLRNGFIYTGSVNDIIKADVNGDGKVDAADIQTVINTILGGSGAKASTEADANLDGAVNSSDVQVVVNQALRR